MKLRFVKVHYNGDSKSPPGTYFELQDGSRYIRVCERFEDILNVHAVVGDIVEVDVASAKIVHACPTCNGKGEI